MIKALSAFAFAGAAALALAVPAQAVEPRMGQTATCSKLNPNKCKSAAVRTTNLGQQVRLPGGTWVYCRGDCQDKLRQKTVDFWYEQKIAN